MKPFIAFILLLLSSTLSFSQTLSGVISDENGAPIPYATIFVKELSMGTTSNSQGAYQLNLSKGEYAIQFRSIGFKQTMLNVLMDTLNVERNVVLPAQTYQLHEVRVYNSKEDQAYPIMRRAIAMAPYYLNQIKEYKASVYLKGTVKIDKVPGIMKKQFKASINGSVMGLDDVYVGESISEIEFNAPDTYHQKIVSSNMTIMSNETSTFDMGLITDSPYQPVISENIISPLSPQSFAHYRFQYEGFYTDGDYLVNKIKILPRRKSKQLLSGYLYIIDGLWCLHGLDLLLNQGYFDFKVNVQLAEMEKGVFMPISHAINLKGKMMGIAAHGTYLSSVKYQTIKKNNELKPPQLLEEYYADEQIKAELAEEQKTKQQQKIDEIMLKDELTKSDAIKLARLMKKEAKKTEPIKENKYEIKNTYHIEKADSASSRSKAYWELMRPNPLSFEEIKSYQKSDSLAALPAAEPDSTKKEKKKYISKILGSKEFKFKGDSIKLGISALISPQLISFNAVEGLKYRQTISYRQQFSSHKKLDLEGWAGYSFNRKRFQWNVNGSYKFAPLRLGVLRVSGGNNIVDYMPNNGVSSIANLVSSLFFKENYARYHQQQYFTLASKIELVNGLFVSGGIAYYRRTHLQNSTNFSFVRPNVAYHANEILDSEGNPVNILNENSAILNFSVEYTPESYYRINHGQKVPQGSQWPTFELIYKKGIQGIWGSSSDWDYLEFGIRQKVKLGISNELSYSAKAGTFLNNKSVAFADYAIIDVSSIPVDVNDRSYTFKLLPYYTYNTSEQFLTVGLNYKTPNLLVKYLPWFSNRRWKENLHINYLTLPDLNNYIELGYSLSNLLSGGELGVYSGFENGTYRQSGIRATLRF